MQIACTASFRGPHLIWSSLYEWPRWPRALSQHWHKSHLQRVVLPRELPLSKSVKVSKPATTWRPRKLDSRWNNFGFNSDLPAHLIRWIKSLLRWHWIKIESCEQSSLQTLFSEHEIGVIGPIVEFDKGESTSKNTFGTLIERGTENILEFKYFPLSPSCRCLENASGQLRFLLLRLS